MEACIVIAKLLGILNSEPIDVYKIDCYETSHNVILQNKEFIEVNVLKINSDLSYNIEIKDI
mgnify:CR=1 FL=1